MKSFFHIFIITLYMTVLSFAQTNVISNGGFEYWTAGVPDNWSKTTTGYNLVQNSDTVYTGAYSVKIILTAQNPTQIFRQDSIPINGGDHYILQMRIYDNDPAGKARFWGYWDGASGGPNAGFYTSDSAGWQLYKFEIDAPDTATGLSLEIRYYDVPNNWDGDAIFFIDEVKILAPPTNIPQFSNITTGLFNANEAIGITADITDDQGIASAWLHYRTNFSIEDSVQMTNITANTWEASILAQSDNTGLEYWISAVDTDLLPNFTISEVQKTIVGLANIARAHEVDGDGNMLFEDFLVKVKGIVTVATGTFSAKHQDDYIQDNTGGVNLFNLTIVKAISEGDSIEASGRFSSDISKNIIVDLSINILNSGNQVPNPVTITTVEMGEQYEGMLIQIDQGTVSGWDTTSSGFTAAYTDGSGDLNLRVHGDTDIPGHSEPQGIINLVGIGSQSDNQSPFTNGYQVMPRYWADFHSLNSIDENYTTPYTFSLKQNYPNPFNPDTKIEFILGSVSDVKLTIFNLLGQKIKSFIATNLKSGVHKFSWNGKDFNGKQTASGIYLYRLNVGNYVFTKKMALIR